MNPKKHNQYRRSRPSYPKGSIPVAKLVKGKLRLPPNPPGQNHVERRKLKARERTVESFSKATKARYIKDIQDKEHREALQRKLIKGPKKPKAPFVSKRSQRVWNPGKKKNEKN